jgi:hypothetical protein
LEANHAIQFAVPLSTCTDLSETAATLGDQDIPASQRVLLLLGGGEVHLQHTLQSKRSILDVRRTEIRDQVVAFGVSWRSLSAHRYLNPLAKRYKTRERWIVRH